MNFLRSISSTIIPTIQKKTAKYRDNKPKTTYIGIPINIETIKYFPNRANTKYSPNQHPDTEQYTAKKC